MKKILSIFAAVFLLSACSRQANVVTVDADKKLNTDFSQYKSFTWASQVDSKLDPGFYFLNDLELKDRIRNAVSYELEARGYAVNRQSPDLIVNFRVFDKATTIKGYTGYGTTYFGAEEVREPEDAKTFEVKAGSIILNLIDKKSGQVVWRGLASGLTNANGFDRNENKVKEAVKLMFDKYEYRADKY